MSPTRALVALTLIAGAAYAANGIRSDRPELLPVFEPPLQLGAWKGGEAEPISAETRAALRADHIVNRTYQDPRGRLVGLYIASYARQRPGISIHSPLHCLPGTGWRVLTDDVMETGAAGGGRVRQLVAVRDRERILVLYWYAIHGRMVASDALSRLYLLHDAVRWRRNGAALVRLVVPMSDENPRRAARDGLAFMRALTPFLSPASTAQRIPPTPRIVG
ncbi:MAG: exosortase C-terminal domain/associated protein EpsI [Vicinamibacterales bacterium]